MFLLGGFVCVVSIYRLKKLLETDFASPDLTWTFTDIAMWSVVETNVALVSACLPSLRPILLVFSSSFGTVYQSQGAIERTFPDIEKWRSGRASSLPTDSEPKSLASAYKPQSTIYENYDLNDLEGIERHKELSFGSSNGETARPNLDSGYETSKKAKRLTHASTKSAKSAKSTRVKVSPEKLQAIEAFDEDYEVFPDHIVSEDRFSPYQAGVEAVRRKLQDLQALDFEYDFHTAERTHASSLSFEEVRNPYAQDQARMP